MIAARDTLVASDQRPLRVRMRPDLQVQRQTYQGRDYWIVKDPVSSQYFRFEEEEFAILQMLDGQESPAEICRRFDESFPPQRLSKTQLQALAANLFQHGLVVSDAAELGAKLCQRGAQRRGRARRDAVTNILAIRLPGIDPDRFLAWLGARVGWLVSGPAVLASLLLMFAALLLVGIHFDSFLRRLPEFREFFALENAAALALVLAGTKVLHELGHGLAARRFGVQCRELGLMLLVFTPCLYCDVSDAWILPSKWKRAAISAAGMYVELTLAAACTILWWFSEPGALHYLCLNVMVICSVSTILFNGNPLLRYDGYYILADLLEIPNLRQKASSLLQRAVAQRLLGITPQPDPFLPARRQWLFMFYSVLAVLYRWFVLISIAWFLYWVLEPLGLQRVGQALIVLVLCGLLVPPVSRSIRFFLTPGRMHEVNIKRGTASLVIIGVVSGVLLLVPLPYSIPGAFEVESREAANIYVTVPGVLQEIHVRPGQTVQAGQPLVTLSNLDLAITLNRLDGEQRRLAARLESLSRAAHANASALQRIAQVNESLAAVRQQIQRRQQDARRLVVRATRAGVVYAAPPIAAAPAEDQLGNWDGHPLQQKNRGAALAEGVLVCRVGDPEKLVATLAIDQSAVPSVATGQRVRLFPDALRGAHLTGQIAEVSQRQQLSEASRPERRSSRANRDARTPRTSPLIKYEVRVPLARAHAELLVGSSGQCRILAGSRCLGRRLVTALQDTFHFRL